MIVNETELSVKGVGFINPPMQDDTDSLRQRQFEQVRRAAQDAETAATQLLLVAAGGLVEVREKFGEIVEGVRALCRTLEKAEREIYEALNITRDLPNVTEGIENQHNFRESIFYSRKLGAEAWEGATRGLDLSPFPRDALETRLGAELAAAVSAMLAEQSGLRVFEPGTESYAERFVKR